MDLTEGHYCNPPLLWLKRLLPATAQAPAASTAVRLELAAVQAMATVAEYLNQFPTTPLPNCYHYLSTIFNPIPPEGGHIVPGRSEMVCHFHRVVARLTKIHDFVPFNV